MQKTRKILLLVLLTIIPILTSQSQAETLVTYDISGFTNMGRSFRILYTMDITADPSQYYQDNRQESAFWRPKKCLFTVDGQAYSGDSNYSSFGQFTKYQSTPFTYLHCQGTTGEGSIKIGFVKHLGFKNTGVAEKIDLPAELEGGRVRVNSKGGSMVYDSFADPVVVNEGVPIDAVALRTTSWIYPDIKPEGADNIMLQAFKNGHDGFQIAITAETGCLENVALKLVSPLTNHNGLTIPAHALKLYQEIPLKITVPTGMRPEIFPEREIFDPLLPLSTQPFDPDTTETNAIHVGRVGATGKSYLAVGDGACFAGGCYTGNTDKHYVLEVDTAGPIGVATFRWSNKWDGKMGNRPYKNYSTEPSVTEWNESNVLIKEGLVPLNEGITLSFTGGGSIHAYNHVNYKNISEYNFHQGDRYYFTAYKQHTAAIFGDLHVPDDQPAGLYSGLIELSADGKGSVIFPVSLRVYDILIPKEKSMISSYGGRPGVRNFHGGEDIETIQKRYEEMLHSHRIDYRTIGSLPTFKFDENEELIKVSWEKFDEIMESRLDGTFWDDGAPMTRYSIGINILNPGNTYYMTRRSPKVKKIMAREIARHLKEKGWFEKVYVYCLDEPYQANFQGILDDIEIMKEADPDWEGKFMITSTPSHDSILQGSIDIWVPPTHQYDRYPANPGKNKYIYSRQDYQDLVLNEGDSFLLYVANYPLSGRYMSYQLDRIALHEPRLLKWASWYEQASGFLYWSTIMPGHGIPNPYLNPYFSENYKRDGTGNGINGDGILLYPGDRDGSDSWARTEGHGVPFTPIDGPLASLRLKQIRNGFEDWEMFILGDKQGKTDQIRFEMDRIYTAITASDDAYNSTGETSWSRNDTLMWEVRNTIAEMVE